MPPKDPRKEPTKGSPEVILPPVMPESVVRVWEEYERLSGVDAERDQLESAEVAARLRDFAGKTELPSSNYHAAYLIRLAEKLSGDEPEASYAKQAIYSYKGEPVIDAISDEELIEIEESLYTQGLDRAEKDEIIKGIAIEKDRKYVLERARDTLQIGIFLRKGHQQNITRREAKQLAGQSVDSPWALSGDEDDEISIRKIANLTSDISDDYAKKPKGVNIESMIINAISAYRKLQNIDTITEAEALKVVYAIENLFKPFIALIRWDGLESGLKAQTKATRMVYAQGIEGVSTPEDLSKAETLIRAAGLHDINIILAMVPKVLNDIFPGNNTVAESVIYDMSGHGIKTGVAKIRPGELDDYLELEEFKGSELNAKWRAKDAKSVADSIHRDPNDHVADLFGILVKVPSYDVAVDMIAIANESLDASEHMELKPSRSREESDTSIVLIGNDMPSYALAPLKEKLGAQGPNIATETKSNGYQVAKMTITFRYTYKGKKYETPIELMFQTSSDREIASVGAAAHLRKAEHLPKEKRYKKPLDEELTYQGRIYLRKEKIGKPGSTTISQQEADAYFRDNNKETAKSPRTVKRIGRSSLMRPLDS